MKCRRSGAGDELLNKCHRAAQCTVEQGTRECAEKIHDGILGEDILRKGMFCCLSKASGSVLCSELQQQIKH